MTFVIFGNRCGETPFPRRQAATGSHGTPVSFIQPSRLTMVQYPSSHPVRLPCPLPDTRRYVAGEHSWMQERLIQVQ
ncbi:hypothetical protein PBY51_016457 [Eleginops maclovinus]|uniref:Uncharacterized protein n=1 Tax=Eleginops maclovinus TaxID=56733 RepID=A0AAN7XQ83_ELEMC|nr:hypothetical protein PBY51_016457 [Eleginops maclovinus]